MGFHDLKLAILTATDLGKDALHVHIGLLIFFGVVIVFRVPVGGRWPLMAVAIAAIGGEAGDIYERSTADVAPDWPAHGKDLWNTLLWPCLLTAWGRWARRHRRVLPAEGKRPAP